VHRQYSLIGVKLSKSNIFNYKVGLVFRPVIKMQWFAQRKANYMKTSIIDTEIDLRLEDLKKAITLAETQPDVVTYSFAGEKYEALMDIVDILDEEESEALVEVIDDLLPTEWVFWMDAVEKAELYGELEDVGESTRH